MPQNDTTLFKDWRERGQRNKKLFVLLYSFISQVPFVILQKLDCGYVSAELQGQSTLDRNVIQTLTR